MKCDYCGAQLEEEVYCDLGEGSIKGVNYVCPFNCDYIEWLKKEKRHKNNKV